MASNSIQVIEHPPYSPDLAPADFFLFQRVKAELGGMTLTSTTFKKTWDGVIRSVGEEDFAVAFRRWFSRCEKCIRVGGEYVEK